MKFVSKSIKGKLGGDLAKHLEEEAKGVVEKLSEKIVLSTLKALDAIMTDVEGGVAEQFGKQGAEKVHRVLAGFWGRVAEAALVESAQTAKKSIKEQLAPKEAPDAEEEPAEEVVVEGSVWDLIEVGLEAKVEGQDSLADKIVQQGFEMLKQESATELSALRALKTAAMLRRAGMEDQADDLNEMINTTREPVETKPVTAGADTDSEMLPEVKTRITDVAAELERLGHVALSADLLGSLE